MYAGRVSAPSLMTIGLRAALVIILTGPTGCVSTTASSAGNAKSAPPREETSHAPRRGTAATHTENLVDLDDGERSASGAKKSRGRNASQKGKQSDAELWAAASIETCKRPKAADACTGVSRYLMQFPEGEHAEEAKALLEAARPVLEPIERDEAAWSLSGYQGCKQDPRKYDCSGVKKYLTRHPDGAHVAEARAILEPLGAVEKEREAAEAASNKALEAHLAFEKKVRQKPQPYIQRGQRAIRERMKGIGRSTDLVYTRNTVSIACLDGDWVLTAHDYTWPNQKGYRVQSSSWVVHLGDGTSRVSDVFPLPHRAALSDVHDKELHLLCSESRPKP